MQRAWFRYRSTIWVMVAAAAMMGLGIALRIPILRYTGRPTERAFHDYIVQYMGAYSDIPQLYLRDQLWSRPIPYVDYTFEYPVGMGLFVWLINTFFHGPVWQYFLATAIALALAGLITVWLLRQFDGANPWLLALSPALVLYTVLNWDMFGIMLLLAALLVLQRERDGWGGLLMAGAVWTKFFPIVALPLVVFDRLLKRRWYDALLFCSVFGLASLALNLPFALFSTPDGPRVRQTWLYFFKFSGDRQPQPWSSNLWNLLDPFDIRIGLADINFISAVLMMLGLVATLGLMYYAFTYRFNYDLVLPASAMMIIWFMFINKIYSPQYSLWIAVLLALLAVPPVLAAAFAGADLIFFGAIWVALSTVRFSSSASSWMWEQAVWPAMVLREAVTLVIIVWIAREMVRRREILARREPFAVPARRAELIATDPESWGTMRP